MSVREKARIVGTVAKTRKQLSVLDTKVKEAEERVHKAQNDLLRLQHAQSQSQDRLDDALAYYDALEERDNG